MRQNSFSQTQSQTQQQIQTLSPQQVLVARLLELTNVELEDRIRGESLENPALESSVSDIINDADDGGNEVAEQGSFEVASSDDYRGEDDVPDYEGWDYRPKGDMLEEIPVSADRSFGDSLLEQLGELSLSKDEYSIGEYLIGSLHEDGLLYKSLGEIADELAIYYGMDISEKKILEILEMIQTFDPPGIGARDLRECLMLQLMRKEQSDVWVTQKMIINNHFDDFAKKRWDTLPDKLRITPQECRMALSELVKLNPRPGASLAETLGSSRQQIIPDFIVDIQGTVVAVALNNGYVPQLYVSEDYMRMLDEQIQGGSADSKSAAQFLKQKIESAKGFISAIKQREDTLLGTMKAIARFQNSFLLEGGDDAALKPMILDDIAKLTGYDISTISRVSSSKYVQLPWGIYSLKYFFTDGVSTQDGQEKSIRELYRYLQQFIDEEDKINPLTDNELMGKLQQQGFTMARRTIAKYREHLRIPVARLRKE